MSIQLCEQDLSVETSTFYETYVYLIAQPRHIPTLDIIYNVVGALNSVIRS